MKNKRKLVAAFAVTVMTMSSVTVFAEETTGSSTADDVWAYRAVADVSSAVNIRANASEDSQIVGTLSTAARADIIERGQEWSYIISGGVEGYVKNEYLAFGEDAEYLASVYGTEGVKTYWDGVNLFSQPDGASQILATASAGQEYQVLSNDGTWIGIQMDDATVAYVPAEDVMSTTILDKAVSVNAYGTGDSGAAYGSYTESYDAGYTESYTEESYDTGYTESYTEESYDTGYTESYTEESYETEYSGSYTEESYETEYSGSYTEESYETEYSGSYTEESYETEYSESYTEESYETESSESYDDGSSSETSSSVNSSDLELLAGLIYCEAGNQSRDGKVAVGAVVMNRVASSSFANSISGVIYESGQFSPAGSGWLDSVIASGAIPSDCYEAAEAAMNGENPVGGAMYFNTGSGKGIQIGAHQFY